MKLALSLLLGVCFSLNAQTVVEQKNYTAEVMHAQKINATVVETTEACVFTYDPQWADEEDTRAAKTIFKSFEEKEGLKVLTDKGYRFFGYKDKETCKVGVSTFPEVLTSNDSLYFSQYTSMGTFLKAINQQKAWKKVKRVYVKGFSELKESLEKKRIQAEKEILERLK